MATPLERLQGKYEILEKLSEGGMGAVYKVRHRLLDEIRVIKIVRPQLEGQAEMRERFFREARIAIRLRHPNIAQVFDFSIDDDGNAFTVQEFIDGITLFELLERMKPPPVALTLEIAVQAAAALGYLHRKRYVHRDISPDNLMLARDDEGGPLVKLIDLGIAKATASASNLTTAGEFVGKVRYASPEQFRGAEGVVVDERSDLYSLGVVMYELLTAVNPIRGESIPAMIASHLLDEPVPFQESDPRGRVPDGLRAIVLRCLARQPDDRWGSAADLGRELAALRPAHPLDRADVEAALNVPAGPTAPIARPPKPGSTQDRLDRQFRVGATPAAAPPGAHTTRRRTQHPRSTAKPQVAEAAEAGQQVSVLLSGARALADQGRLTEARLQLAAVLRLDPGNAEAERLFTEVEASLERKRVAQVRGAAVADVEAHLAAGRPAEAEARLAAAEREIGTDEELSALRARVDEVVARERSARVSELLQNARRAGEERRFDDAAAALAEASGLAPGDEAIRQALAALEAARASAERERLERRTVSEAVAAADDLVARREFREALRRLDETAREVGDRAELRAARARAEQAREARRRQDVVTDLLERAGALADDKDFAGALELLGQATGVGVADPDLVRQIGEAQAGVSRRDEEERRRTVADLLERALSLAAEKGFAAALDLVEQARAVGVADRHLQRLIPETEHAVKRQQDDERRRQVDDLVQRAGSRAEARDLTGALELLRQARGVDAADRDVARLIAETEEAIQRRDDERRRLKKLTAAADRVEDCLAAGDLVEAERALAVAEKLFPGDPTFVTLRVRTEEMVERRREDTFAELRENAGRLISEAKHERAIELVQSAAAADPTDTRVRRLLETARRSAAEAAVEASLARGDLGGADRALDLAERLYGFHRALRELRRRTEELRRRQVGE
ncbi:MAG TPA: serine/threonine-protein kinase [Thermoanaerobaculaceae bacterium]|nr:serine/threonine-protein kinase [Thermoanaerobaculaceae bacterium]